MFWLGTHQLSWLGRTDVPLFLSARRLRGQKKLSRSSGPVAVDSGRFTECSRGEPPWPPRWYASEVLRWTESVGLTWAVIQDWMCEPFILAKTGLTVLEHQRRTVDSYMMLRRLAPEVHWVPVLQGWRYEDYLDHLGQYASAGVDLALLPLVGLGSVCRRQATGEAEHIVRGLASRGLRLHGFGFKLSGLARVADVMVSADSMAWSFAARRRPPLPGHRHKNCANCLEYAIGWRSRALRVIAET